MATKTEAPSGISRTAFQRAKPEKHEVVDKNERRWPVLQNLCQGHDLRLEIRYNGQPKVICYDRNLGVVDHLYNPMPDFNDPRARIEEALHAP